MHSGYDEDEDEDYAGHATCVSLVPLSTSTRFSGLKWAGTSIWLDLGIYARFERPRWECGWSGIRMAVAA